MPSASPIQPGDITSVNLPILACMRFLHVLRQKIGRILSKD